MFSQYTDLSRPLFKKLQLLDIVIIDIEIVYLLDAHLVMNGTPIDLNVYGCTLYFTETSRKITIKNKDKNAYVKMYNRTDNTN